LRAVRTLRSSSRILTISSGLSLSLLTTSKFFSSCIAHEVPRNSVCPGGPLPLEVIKPPSPTGVTRTSERLGAIAHAATISLLKGVLVTARAPVVGASAAGAFIAGLLLDPVIFGAFADEHGMATWFVLAQWVW
jgi:hypothetical protein